MTLFDPVPPSPPDDAPMVRARLVLAYDGTGFHGFAENRGVRTIAGALRPAIERVVGHHVELSTAGRTDRGVHARGQVVSFDAVADRFDPAAMMRALNKLVKPEIAVLDAAVADPGFDARFSATGRVYRYRVDNRPVHDPLRARTTWHVAAPLDVAALRLGADPLIGSHDFRSFCRKPPSGSRRPASFVRHVRRAHWTDRGEGLLEFEIEAGAFCHQMVRSIVGTLVDMGIGRRRAGEMLGILAARDRDVAGTVAPPQGLVLWAVRYDERPGGER